jgi:hypothetical protein
MLEQFPREISPALGQSQKQRISIRLVVTLVAAALHMSKDLEQNFWRGGLIRDQ